MNKDIPLTLKLEPGEYQCYAALPDHDGSTVRLGGMLSLQGNQPPELGLHGGIPEEATNDPDKNLTWSTYPQVSELPLLRVDLVRGNDVLLLDCAVNKVLPGRALVTAAAALVGVNIPEDDQPPQFTSLTVQISGAAAVIAPPPLVSVTIPIQREPETPMVWTATERLPRKITDNDDGAEVTAYWYVSFSGNDGYAHRVSFSPVIEITLNEPVDLATLREQWLEPLHRIIGLSTGRAETTTYLGVELAGGGGRELQVYGTNITQQPYAPRLNDLLKIEQAFHTYGDDDTSLLQLCRGWQTASAERHPLVETLGTFLSLPPQHPRARFLLLVQALEGLHGHHDPDAEDRLAQHRANRKQAREDVKNCDGLDPEVRKFVRDALPNRPPSNLEHALKDVVTDLPVDLTPKLNNLELVTALTAEDEEVTDWTSAMRIVRNGLSHGDRGWPPSVLEPAAELLEVIARAHLMRTIGVNGTSIEHYLSSKFGI
jgi:hypothetical protein